MPRLSVFALAALLSFSLSGPTLADESFECLIAPWQVVNLGARSTGVLDELNVDRGDQIAAGQQVAVLNSEIETVTTQLTKERAESTIQIQLAEARREYERLAVERNRELFERTILSSQDLEASEASFRISALQVTEAMNAKRLAGLEYARAKAIFDLRTIRSPIDGVVLTTNRTAGEYLAENDHVATIAKIDPLQVEAFLPLDMIDRLEVGTEVVVSPQEPVGGEFPGIIDVVDLVVDARSGTIGIRIRIENPEKLTIAGLRCSVQIQ